MVSNRLLSLEFEVWCGVTRVLVGQVPVRSRGSGVLELQMPFLWYLHTGVSLDSNLIHSFRLFELRKFELGSNFYH